MATLNSKISKAIFAVVASLLSILHGKMYGASLHFSIYQAKLCSTLQYEIY